MIKFYKRRKAAIVKEIHMAADTYYGDGIWDIDKSVIDKLLDDLFNLGREIGSNNDKTGRH